MEILGTPFSREEALEIISQPNFWSELVFANGSRLASVYPPPEVARSTYSVRACQEEGDTPRWPDTGECATDGARARDWRPIDSQHSLATGQEPLPSLHRVTPAEFQLPKGRTTKRLAA